MATENPKVSAYVPKALKDRLTQFREERGISESQAVIIVLAEYFGLEQELNRSPAQVGGVSLARVDAIEAQLSELEDLVHQRFTALTNKLSSIQQSSSQVQVSSPPLDTISQIEVQPDSKQLKLPVNDLVSQDRQQLELSAFPPVAIKPVSGLNLSEFRFGLSKDMVSGTKRKRTTEQFIEWTKQKDPDHIPWKYVESPSKGYLPDIDIDSLSSDIRSRLLNWIDEYT